MAEMPIVAVDTNVVVAGLLAWHEQHGPALSLLQRHLASGSLVLPAPALVESYSVLTRLPPPWRLAPADVATLLTRTFRERSRLVGLGEDEPWFLLGHAVERGVAGGSIHDAHILACAKKAGASVMATFNRRHFAQLDLEGIELLVPTAT